MDRTHTKIGKTRPWMFAAASVLTMSFVEPFGGGMVGWITVAIADLEAAK